MFQHPFNELVSQLLSTCHKAGPQEKWPEAIAGYIDRLYFGKRSDDEGRDPERVLRDLVGVLQIAESSPCIVQPASDNQAQPIPLPLLTGRYLRSAPRFGTVPPQIYLQDRLTVPGFINELLETLRAAVIETSLELVHYYAVEQPHSAATANGSVQASHGSTNHANCLSAVGNGSPATHRKDLSLTGVDFSGIPNAETLLHLSRDVRPAVPGV